MEEAQRIVSAVRLYLNNIQNTTLQNAYVCNQNKVIIKILI